MLPACTTATPDPSPVFDLHHSSWQCQILNALSNASSMVPSQICFCCAKTELLISFFSYPKQLSTFLRKLFPLIHFLFTFREQVYSQNSICFLFYITYCSIRCGVPEFSQCSQPVCWSIKSVRGSALWPSASSLFFTLILQALPLCVCACVAAMEGHRVWGAD